MEQDPLELIRRIASVVGHELRNPLAVINNSAYFLKTKLGGDGRLDPKVEKHLGIVSSEIARVDRMIGDLLAFPRPLELKPVVSPLNPVVEEALADFVFPPNVKLEKALDPKPPKASLDAAALKEALRRLLENAVDAMPEGGTLRVATSAGPGGPAIEIRDSGAGIRPEALKLMFEPFYTTKPRGLGLGLSMARKAAAAMKASVEGGNAPGGGAVFRFSWID
jgi:signal transduction histidine kinase